MEVYLLGQFQVKVDGEVITSLNHPRLQELLAYLLLQQGKSVSRRQIAFLFWPDSSEEQARTNLRNLLHRLRRAFPASDHFLVINETHLQWRSDISFTLDVIEFEDAILQAESAQGSDQVEFLAQAARLYGGDLLPECYSDWLLAERERLRQSYMSILEKVAGLYEDQRSYAKAIQPVHDLLRQDPLNENAYARLMRLYAIESTRETMLRYFNAEHSDVSIMAEDVVFNIMATGQEHHGRDAVLGMLNYFYHIAFEATATTRVTLFGENNAMVEGDFVGKHIGEFAGIPATGKDVRVPLCMVYDLANDQIKHGCVYFEMPALLQQLGVSMG